MNKKLSKEEFREKVKQATKIIKKYIIMMIGLYIGFTVMTGFLRFEKSQASMIISLGLGLAIVGMLIYNIIIIKQAKQRLNSIQTNNNHNE